MRVSNTATDFLSAAHRMLWYAQADLERRGKDTAAEDAAMIALEVHRLAESLRRSGRTPAGLHSPGGPPCVSQELRARE